MPLALTHDSTKPPLQGRRLYFMLFWNPTLCDIGPMVDGWGQLEIMISGGEMKFGRGVGDGLGMSAEHYCSLRGWTVGHWTYTTLLPLILSLNHTNTQTQMHTNTSTFTNTHLPIHKHTHTHAKTQINLVSQEINRRADRTTKQPSQCIQVDPPAQQSQGFMR